MTWPASLGVGVLTALLACVLAGVVAGLYVDWYRVSSFEGAAGYLVVAMALLGGVAGALIGIGVSRWVGASGAGFLRALGTSWLAVLVLLGGIAATARMLADVPPRLDGRSLVLSVEVQWPAGAAPVTAPDTAVPYLRLSALRGRTVRTGEDGPLWLEDARTEEGRMIVPGAVDVFTSRGGRMLNIEPADVAGEGFLIPLPRRPTAAQYEWSEWLPQHPGGDVAGRFRYRFRVVPDDQPIRTRSAGPFEIGTIAGGFARYRAADGRETWAADTRFLVRHRGEPVVLAHRTTGDSVIRFDRMAALSVIEGPRPALLVGVGRSGGDGGSYLVHAIGDELRIEPVSDDAEPLVRPLTNDAAAFEVARDRTASAADVDRTTFAQPGAYLIGTAVLDTRTLTIQRLTSAGAGDVIERIPPLGIAPDGTSIVRLAWTGEGEQTRLAVLGLSGRADQHVDIDRTRMRYADIDQIDPAWLTHYYAWRRGAEGLDHLEARADALPLPFRGVLTTDGADYREYRLSPAGPGLRAAFEAFLVEEMGATADGYDEAEFAHDVRIGDATVHVSYRAEDGHVGLWMDRGVDSLLVETIAARFDSVLATGRYDGLFGG